MSQVNTIDSITIIRPDDMHLHLRDGALMRLAVTHSAGQFARAIIMPNLQPPIVNCQQAVAYRQRILSAVPEGVNFEPLMTLYLTADTTADEIARLAETAGVFAVKYYPAHATTHSAHGVDDIREMSAVLEAMQRHQVPLLLHGEVVADEVDVFDREAVFIERILAPLQQDFPALPMVLEHISTKEAVDFITAMPAHVAATITAHHLLLNRNALFAGGLRPHHYCLPILKAFAHQRAVVQAATSGNTKFFAGTDSAPHLRHQKESDCGCAGIYTAPTAIALYAEVFAAENALEHLEKFCAQNGASFYHLTQNQEKLRLQRRPLPLPLCYTVAEDEDVKKEEKAELVPFRAGQQCAWQWEVVAGDG